MRIRIHMSGQFALSNVSKSFGWMRFMKIIWHHFLLFVQKRISGKKLIQQIHTYRREKKCEIVCSRLLPAALDYVPLQMAVIKLQSLLLLHVWLPWYTRRSTSFMFIGRFHTIEFTSSSLYNQVRNIFSNHCRCLAATASSGCSSSNNKMQREEEKTRESVEVLREYMHFNRPYTNL